ncbi:MAG: CHC2 zinc finger domain-containing protein [Opitutaceae bacterium]
MARIPEEELERLKREVDLASLVRSKNIELKAHGSKDLIGRCPFHQDDSPSFIVTPSKNLFHCLGCGAGGSVIDFVMKHDGVSFRHTVELLRESGPQLFGGATVKVSTVPKLQSPVAFDADDQALFKQVLDYYHERLLQSKPALDYLQSRTITQEAIETFRIGLADRTLGLRLPQKNRRDGAEVRQRLTRLGSTGNPATNTSAAVPSFRLLENRRGDRGLRSTLSASRQAGSTTSPADRIGACSTRKPSIRPK